MAVRAKRARNNRRTEEAQEAGETWVLLFIPPYSNTQSGPPFHLTPRSHNTVCGWMDLRVCYGVAMTDLHTHKFLDL